MAAYKDRLNIFVQEFGSQEEAVRITEETERNISGYFWASNDRLLFIRDNAGDENFHIFSVGVADKEVVNLTPWKNVRASIIDDLVDFENEIIITANKRNEQLFDVYRMNIISGERQLIAENPGNIIGWKTDWEGKLRIAIASDSVNTVVYHRFNEEEQFQPLVQTNFRENLSPIQFSADGKQLYAASNIARDKGALVLFDLESKQEVEVLYEHPEVDISSAGFSRISRSLQAVSFVTDKMGVHFFDSDAEALYSELKDLIGHQYQIIISERDRAEKRLLVTASSDRCSGKYYLYDIDTKTLTFLGDATPWLKEEQLAEMKPISYSSRDGMTIHGYLTVPKGAEAFQLPVIVNPHGGPWHRDTWGYNPEIQFLANRGYAVLQMNFRGSTGYGRAFLESSFKQWGLKMQDDISDGVQWLIDQEIADPDRIAIYGGSYGGYATLAGLAFTPDLYACGVDFVGVSNLFTFMKTIPPYWKPMLDMMFEMVGHPEKDKDQLHATSPVFHVDKIKAPLFVAQGAMDPRVNINESNQIVNALRARGVEVEYMVKENEGHGFMNQENRFEFYESMENFLNTHLKNNDDFFGSDVLDSMMMDDGF